MLGYVFFIPILLRLQKLFIHKPFVFPEYINIHNSSTYESLEGINETELYLFADKIIVDTLENKITWEEFMKFGNHL